MQNLSKVFLRSLVVLMIFSGCGRADKGVLAKDFEPDEEQPVAEEPPVADMEIGQLADSVVVWFRSCDFRTTGLIEQVVHSDKGVRFSPYPFINDETDRLLSGSYIRSVGFMDKREWGKYDGSGEPILLDGIEFCEKFIADADYLRKGQKLVNQTKGTGNSKDNMKEVYPDSEYVEYYIPGTEKNAFMDWKSLRLVFEKENGKWKLVGVIHGQWTI